MQPISRREAQKKDHYIVVILKFQLDQKYVYFSCIMIPYDVLFKPILRIIVVNVEGAFTSYLIITERAWVKVLSAGAAEFICIQIFLD